MYYYFMYNREDFLAHYHKRSNVETAFSMIQGKLVILCGARVTSGNSTRCFVKFYAIICASLSRRFMSWALNRLWCRIPAFTKSCGKVRLLVQSRLC